MVTGADSRADTERYPIYVVLRTKVTFIIQSVEAASQLWRLFCCTCVPGILPRLPRRVAKPLTCGQVSSGVNGNSHFWTRRECDLTP